MTPESSRSQRRRTRVLRWVGSLFLRRREAHLRLSSTSSGPKALRQFSIRPPDAAQVQLLLSEPLDFTACRVETAKLLVENAALEIPALRGDSDARGWLADLAQRHLAHLVNLTVLCFRQTLRCLSVQLSAPHNPDPPRSQKRRSLWETSSLRCVVTQRGPHCTHCSLCLGVRCS